MTTETVQEFKETKIGKIPIDWNIEKLEDVIETILDRRGITPKKLNSDWVKKGWSVISAKNIKDGKLIRKEIIRFVDHTTYEKWMSKKIKEGDIILTSEGPLGELYHVKDFKEFCIGQRLFAIRCNAKKISDNFLFFYLFSIKGQQELSLRATGTTVSGIRQEELRKILICFPKKLNEQQKIGKILLDLHTKIDNLQNQNRILEQMAQAIFKSWFVDFDGVTEFEDSELGKIPKGWSVKKFSDVSNILSGGTPSTKNPNFWNGEIKWIAIDDLKQGMFILDSEKKITQLGLDKSSAKILPVNSIVISARGTVGVFSIMSESMTINQSCYGLTGKGIVNEVFLFFLLRFSLNNFIQNVHGTVFDTITRKTFDEINVIVPNNEKIVEFQNSMKSSFQKIQKIQIQIQSLTKTRDALLPKLMSGEIRV